MSNENMSSFQEKCIEECERVLSQIKGLQNINFNEIVGKTEIYYKADLVISGIALRIFIYRDEAEFIFGDRNPRFEVEDYDNQDALIKSFVNKLESIVIQKE